jgi:steroid delta-isomerase
MPTPDEITATVETYTKSFEAADRERWISLFTEDAEQIDPYPAPANVGHEGLGGFWDRTFAMSSNFEFTAHHKVVAHDRAAMVFTLSLEMGGSRYAFDGVDLFEFADDGRIAKLTAYWDPTQVRPV